MRILSGGRVVGLDRCPGFDCLEELLPAKLNVLLWFLDGAERRRQLQAKFNTVESAATAAEGGCYANGKITRLPAMAWALAGLATLFSLVGSITHDLGTSGRSMTDLAHMDSNH